MPIHVEAEFRPFSQSEFGAIAYQVMGHVFQIRRDLGRMFEESIYQIEVAARLVEAQIEVPIHVAFDSFKRDYFLDLLASRGAIFEFKAVENVTPRHRAQFLNTLMLTGSSHGKLINLRRERIDHEFVNTSLSLADRTRFVVNARRWSEFDGVKPGLIEWLESCLRDWGAGLDTALYEDAAAHFFGGPTLIHGETEIVVDSRVIGKMPIAIAGPRTAFKVTALEPQDLAAHEQHIRRFLNHTSLSALQWINIHRTEITFQSLRRTEPT